jgi:hypothetical protein
MRQPLTPSWMRKGRDGNDFPIADGKAMLSPAPVKSVRYSRPQYRVIWLIGSFEASSSTVRFACFAGEV